MRKFLSILLALTLLLSLAAPVAVFAEEEATSGESYDLTVGGVAVTAENAGDILGDGTASYDASCATLTLNGADIAVESGEGIRFGFDLTIVLQGENSVVSQGEYGISAVGAALTVGGDGSLTVSGADYGICTSGAGKGVLTVCENAVVDATGTGAQSGGTYGIYTRDAFIVEEDAVVTATSLQAPGRSSGVYTYTELLLRDNAQLTAVGGTTTVDSYGIRTTDIVVEDDASLTAIGAQGYYLSQGIWTQTLIVRDNASVDAQAGTTLQGPSVGLQVNGPMTVEGGSVSAEGAEASGGIADQSVGIQVGSVTGNEGILTVSGGSVNASAGAAAMTYGITADHLMVSGGDVNAGAADAVEYSWGMQVTNSLTITGGSVAAYGGNAQDYSYGMQTTEMANLCGGDVMACAGEADNSCGLWAFGNVNVENCQLDVWSSGNGIYTYGALALSDTEGVTELEIRGENYGVCAAEGITVEGLVISTPANGQVIMLEESEKWVVADETGTPVADVLFTLPVTLTLGDTVVVKNSVIINDSGDGWSYEAGMYGEAGTLYLNNVEITSYKENPMGITGLYCDNDLNIVLTGENTIDLSAQSSKASASAIQVKGQLNVEGEGSLMAVSADAAQDSAGIYCMDGLHVYGVSVVAVGGTAQRSFGVVVLNGVSVDFEGSLTAEGGTAEGDKAYSTGLMCRAESYGNIAVHNGWLQASGGQATGQELAASRGVELYNAGLYAYELNSGIIAVSDTAVAEQGSAFSNGVYVYGGDLELENGIATISAGAVQGNEDSNGHGVWVEYQPEDFGWSGGGVGISCNELLPNPNGNGLMGTKVTITAQDGVAIYAQGNLDIGGFFSDYEMTISQPENSEVKGIGGNEDQENWKQPDYYTVVDQEGAVVSEVVIEPLTYKLHISGLKYQMVMRVPAGRSANEIYCEQYGVKDLAEILDTDKDGYRFAGWYTDEQFAADSAFDFDDVIEEELTIYPKWVKKILVPTGPEKAEEDEAEKPEEEEPVVMPAYVDLDPNAWYTEAVAYVSGRGLMTGISVERFDPAGTVSRAMLVTSLWRLEGEPVVNYAMQFADVPQGAWYSEAVRWAAACGIVQGDGENFAPMDAITREQFATILYRYEQYKGGGFKGMWMFLLNCTDREQIAEWAYEPMCWMSMQGVIQGDGTGALAPKSSTTRSQMAQILMNYLER